MELTISQTLIILSRIASINEQIRALLKSCVTDEIYDEVNDIRRIVYEAYDEGPIKVDVKIAFSYMKGIAKVIEQIAKQAEKNSRFICYIDANKILTDLTKLNRDIKRQNRP